MSPYTLADFYAVQDELNGEITGLELVEKGHLVHEEESLNLIRHIFIDKIVLSIMASPDQEACLGRLKTEPVDEELFEDIKSRFGPQRAAKFRMINPQAADLAANVMAALQSEQIVERLTIIYQYELLPIDLDQICDIDGEIQWHFMPGCRELSHEISQTARHYTFGDRPTIQELGLPEDLTRHLRSCLVCRPKMLPHLYSLIDMDFR